MTRGAPGVPTAVEPEHEWLGPWVLRGLEEPVEERGAALLADGDVARVVREAGVEGLARHARHPVPLLLPAPPLRLGGDGGGGGYHEDEEADDGAKEEESGGARHRGRSARGEHGGGQQ